MSTMDFANTEARVTFVGQSGEVGARHAQILPLESSTVIGQREQRQARVGMQNSGDCVSVFFTGKNSSMFPDCREARKR